MVAVVVSAALAFLGNQNRERTETAVNRHFEMVARLSDLLTLMLNAETGLRGCLLTHRAEFLEPFALARRSLPGELDRLRTFVEAEPGDGPRVQKRARLEEVRQTIERELGLLDALQQVDGSSQRADPGARLAEELTQSKETMDALRKQFLVSKNGPLPHRRVVLELAFPSLGRKCFIKQLPLLNNFRGRF